MITKVKKTKCTYHINGKSVIAQPIRMTKNYKLVYYTEKGIKEIIEAPEKKIAEPKNPSEEKKLIKRGYIAINPIKDIKDTL